MDDAHHSSQTESKVGAAAPPNIPPQQWQRFQALKLRRQELCHSSRGKRSSQVKRRVLKKVSKELSSADKVVLAEDDVKFSSLGKRQHRIVCNPSQLDSEKEEGRTKWGEVKKYLDPNPQLKGWKTSSSLQPKSKLEKTLDSAIKVGDHNEAVAISDKLASQEFACKVATSFECLDYIKKCKVDKTKKPTKLKWTFEQKQRWETKGNM